MADDNTLQWTVTRPQAALVGCGLSVAALATVQGQQVLLVIPLLSAGLVGVLTGLVTHLKSTNPGPIEFNKLNAKSI